MAQDGWAACVAGVSVRIAFWVEAQGEQWIVKSQARGEARITTCGSPHATQSAAWTAAGNAASRYRNARIMPRPYWVNAPGADGGRVFLGGLAAN